MRDYYPIKISTIMDSLSSDGFPIDKRTNLVFLVLFALRILASILSDFDEFCNTTFI